MGLPNFAVRFGLLGSAPQTPVMCMNRRWLWRVRLIATWLLMATIGASLPGDRRATERSADCRVSAACNLPEATAAIARQPVAVSTNPPESAWKVIWLVFPLGNQKAPVQRRAAELAACWEDSPLSFWRDIRLQI